MKYVDAQLLQHLAWLLRDHAEIVSGAYKQRTTQQGVEGGGWRDLTDEEKLKSAIDTMGRRCRFIGECVDFIGRPPTETSEP